MFNALKIGVAFILSMLCSNLLLAQHISQPLQISLSGGYERQNLDWSIAGNINGQSPNVFSELKWKGVSGPSINTAVQYTFWKNFAAMASYAHVFIRSGRVTDNDYNGDNRTNQVYGETFNSNKGNIIRWNVGLGYEIVNNHEFSLAPFVGYEASKQSLSILDLTGEFPELNSNYNPVWKSVFIKCLAQLKLNNAFKLVADIGYNQSKYRAIADWNIIQTFQHPISYRHTANGYSVNVNAALACGITRNITVNIGGGYCGATTGTGIDELYLATGEVERTQLNGVSSTAFHMFGGLVLSY